jgi:hypothetical protein
MTPAVLRHLIHLLESHKDAAQAVGSIATVVAVAMGGAWTYVLFRWRRIRYPRLNVQHKIYHWPVNGKLLLHVAVETKSVGDVVLCLESMFVRVQQLMPLPADVLAAMASGKDPVAQNESEVAWPEIDCRPCNWKAEPREIEPGEIEEHHFDFVIPAYVERIEVYSHIVNARKARRLLFWKARKAIGWNTTTVYSLEAAEEHMSKDNKGAEFRTGQGPAKKAPPAAPPPQPKSNPK